AGDAMIAERPVESTVCVDAGEDEAVRIFAGDQDPVPRQAAQAPHVVAEAAGSPGKAPVAERRHRLAAGVVARQDHALARAGEDDITVRSEDQAEGIVGRGDVDGAETAA